MNSAGLFLLLVGILICVFVFVAQNAKHRRKMEMEGNLEKLNKLLSENKIRQADKTAIENYLKGKSYSKINFDNYIDQAIEIKSRLSMLYDKYGEEIGVKIFKEEFWLGMTKEQLIDSKGKPDKIETEVLKTKTKEIYIYGNKSSGDVFTFVDEQLERFKDR